MKYIIVGLGVFGGSLSEKLTAMGNEVIGVDAKMERVEFFKEKISHTIRMDATDEHTVSGLPLKETDVVIIAIGENQGSNILATALFKNNKVKKLISRAINPLHQKVLEALGVDEIVHPEEESAERWSKKLQLKNVVDSYELGTDYSIIEANVPEKYIGKSLKEVGFRNLFNLLVLTIMSKETDKGVSAVDRGDLIIKGIAGPDQKLLKDDILVLYGSNDDLQAFLQKNQF